MKVHFKAFKRLLFLQSQRHNYLSSKSTGPLLTGWLHNRLAAPLGDHTTKYFEGKKRINDLCLIVTAFVFKLFLILASNIVCPYCTSLLALVALFAYWDVKINVFEYWLSSMFWLTLLFSWALALHNEAWSLLRCFSYSCN